MGDGASAATAAAVLNAVFRATSFSETAVWMQLHIGAPGAAGTANPAANTTRVNVTSSFGTAATTGTIANTVEIDWTSVSAAETYSHYTIWTASTAGTFVASGTVTANAVAIGDNFSIPIGDAVSTFPVAS